MLYIVSRKNNQTKLEEIIWHIGEPMKLDDYTMSLVDHIQADNDELEAIRLRFPNLTPSKIRTARWYGDLAKTILWSLSR